MTHYMLSKSMIICGWHSTRGIQKKNDKIMHATQSQSFDETHNNNVETQQPVEMIVDLCKNI